jgi:RNA polymerase sigma-70 factor (ECF subfamily)
VNSGLQRARKAVEERVPAQSQQQTLRALGDEELRELVRTYADAWERNDVETVVAMLTEDAAISMPPLASWFGPRDEMARFLALFPLSGTWRWKALPTTANGQPALAFYVWEDEAHGYLPFALNVLTLRGDKVADVVAFAVRSIEPEEREKYHRWVDQPADEERLAIAFERFGMPPRLD